MENLLPAMCAALAATTAVLLLKLYFMRRSAREIVRRLSCLLADDTNILIDISSRDRAMRELASALNRELRSLRAKRQRYQQGDLELKEAVTNISHDLRTPLTAICGYLELLEREKLPEQAQTYLEVIRERAQVMRGLTEELLRYSILKSAGGLTPEKVSLNRALEESIAAYYSVIAGRGIEPQIAMPGQPVQRVLDRNALSRILGNILSNAVKYSDGDLRVELRQDGEIIFSNHAAALDELQTAQLFGRYYTVDAARDSTGLGLTIARTLTGQMGGKIYAGYREGVFSVHVCFPANGAPARENEKM